MHTSEYDEDGVTFHHNGGYYGDVKVVLHDTDKAQMELDHRDHTISVNVPFSAMEKLVLDKLRLEKISKLESDNFEELRRELFR